MCEHKWLTTGKSGFHKANSVVNIGTALENLENTATVDSDIMSKISASNEDLLQTNSNLTLQLSELTAQIKMDIKIIQ